MLSTKSFQAKAGQLNRQWYVIDAKDQVVGRLAAQIAPILMGKHRPTYTPHIDTGDYVIVINVEKVNFTGDKWHQKFYQRYSGYPGGQKEEPAWRLHQRHPERILYEAIRRMMPKNKIGRHMLDKLKLVVGPDHPHQAQQPIPLEPLHGRPTAAGLQLAPKSNVPKTRVKKDRPSKSVDESAASETPMAPVADAPVITQAEDDAAVPPEVQSTVQSAKDVVDDEIKPQAE